MLLAHPEIAVSLDRGRLRAGRGDAWARFVARKTLLALHQVTPRELKVLSQLNVLGKVSAPRDYLFVLEAMRQAVEAH